MGEGDGSEDVSCECSILVSIVKCNVVGIVSMAANGRGCRLAVMIHNAVLCVVELGVLRSNFVRKNLSGGERVQEHAESPLILD